MPKWRFGVKTVLLFLGLLLPILAIHYGIERSSDWLVAVYFMAFISYLIICYKKPEISFKQIILLAMLARVLLFFGSPGLSDDYFRFLWDGRIGMEGINPYSSSPNELINQLPASYNELYSNLNSPEYHSTYPPISQYIFAIATWLGMDNIFLSMSFLRGFILLFEIGTLFLLFQLTTSTSKVMIYAFNPLVILELTGNLHFEGVVVFFVLLSCWLYQKNHWRRAAMSLAFGILAKLTPLMFLPFLIRKIDIKRAMACYLIIIAVLIALSVPILSFDILNGLDLFFRKFEFNAGLFFLVREIGFGVMGYDIVQTAGPRMSLLALVLILGYSFVIVNRSTDWYKGLTVILFIQLLLATTVHPWYVIPLVAFSCMTGYAFPILWSLLAFFSYLGYTPDGYEHPMIWIALEYLMVISVGLYEITKRKPLLQHV